MLASFCCLFMIFILPPDYEGDMNEYANTQWVCFFDSFSMSIQLISEVFACKDILSSQNGKKIRSKPDPSSIWHVYKYTSSFD
jgi:hypothetical protein